MDIRISAKHITLTPSLETYIRGKVQDLDRLFPNITRVEVQIEVFRNKQHGDDLHRAEILVHVPKRTLRAEQRASEMHEAFDLALPKIERQLEKHKGRLRRRDRNFLRRLGSVFSPFRRKEAEGAEAIPESEDRDE